MLEPKHRYEKMIRQAEKYCDRERPPHAFGESYQAYYSERGKATYTFDVDVTIEQRGRS